MRIYISRHGEAEPFASDDSQRPLTRAGEREVRLLWGRLREAGIAPTCLISSPFLRARQTADQIADLYPGIGRDVYQGLTPDAEPSILLDWLQTRSDLDQLVLVSHMPLVAVLTSCLTGEMSRAGFATAAVAALDMEVAARGCASLAWVRGPGEDF